MIFYSTMFHNFLLPISVNNIWLLSSFSNDDYISTPIKSFHCESLRVPRNGRPLIYIFFFFEEGALNFMFWLRCMKTLCWDVKCHTFSTNINNFQIYILNIQYTLTIYIRIRIGILQSINFSFM